MLFTVGTAYSKFVYKWLVPGMLKTLAFNSATHLLREPRLDSFIVAALINFAAVGSKIIKWIHFAFGEAEGNM